MDSHSFVWDKEQVQQFYSFLPDLLPHESRFISLSARNKYNKSNSDIKLGRTEMFKRKIISNDSFDEYYKSILEYETKVGSITTKTGQAIPTRLMVIYANLNPSDGIKALEAFRQATDEIIFSYFTDKSEEKLKKFANLTSLLNTCYQKNTNNYFKDFDFDISSEDYYLVESFQQDLVKHRVNHFITETFGGYHVTCVRSTLNYNYTTSLKALDRKAKGINPKNEVIDNKNLMLGIPGTYGAGFPIKIISKDYMEENVYG
jgi:CRISPR/Cas system CSM-associated protein Csm2 small subunit